MVCPGNDNKEAYYRAASVGLAAGIMILTGNPALASLQGVCSNCHTMHNSQNAAASTFDSSSAPNESLLKGDCLGCHAQAGPQAKITLGADVMPQVYHTDATDLAGGNFAYITGDKGSGAADSKGHNIAELTGADATLFGPPGGIVQTFHDDGFTVNTDVLTCAGTNGCHGYRFAATSNGIRGAHHNNEGGQLSVADSKGNSYRFLTGVKGYESPDWEYNATTSNHNEYFALTAPIEMDCTTSGCHVGPEGSVAPPDGTMSQYCATCHGNFHTLETGTSDGIGGGGSSPFIRHPTDLVLPDDSGEENREYYNYTTYSLQAPVGRTGSVPATSSDTVVPGSDAVMCLSCHRAHASDYPDMLRWDYDQMLAGGGGDDGAGCFVCHTVKDDAM